MTTDLKKSQAKITKKYFGRSNLHAYQKNESQL